jgi:hypothetical protein
MASQRLARANIQHYNYKVLGTDGIEKEGAVINPVAVETADASTATRSSSSINYDISSDDDDLETPNTSLLSMPPSTP